MKKEHDDKESGNPETVKAALVHYDRCLFGRRSSVTKAGQFLRNLGINTHGVQIGRLARHHCQFWLVMNGGRRTARRVAFDAAEWRAIQNWIRDHDGEIDIELDTIQSVHRRILHAGILCSAAAVREVLPDRLKLLPMNTPLATFAPPPTNGPATTVAA